MKRFFIFLFTILFFWPGVSGQIIANYSPYKEMSGAQLESYRQQIWNNLPAAVGWVNDFAGLYKLAEEDSLETILEHFEKKTTIEICVVTIDSNMVEKEKFDEFAYRLMKLWGVGKITKSNGIVICICKDYKKLSVKTDFGIDKFINENEKNKIINKDFIPSFARSNYFGGTLKGLNAILEKINKRWKDN